MSQHHRSPDKNPANKNRPKTMGGDSLSPKKKNQQSTK